MPNAEKKFNFKHNYLYSKVTPLIDNRLGIKESEELPIEKTHDDSDDGKTTTAYYDWLIDVSNLLIDVNDWLIDVGDWLIYMGYRHIDVSDWPIIESGLDIKESEELPIEKTHNDSNDEKTAIACDDVDNLPNLPNIDMSNWPIIENSSNLDLEKNIDRYFQPKGEPFIKLKTLLTESKKSLISEKNLIDEFYEKMEKVETESNMRNALESIQSITDEYLKKGINLNLNYNGKTVTNLIFEKITYVLDDIVQIIPRNRNYDSSDENEIDENEVDENEVFDSDGTEKKL